MGFNKLFKTPSVSSPSTVETEPPTVTEVQEVDTRSDYAQRSSRRRGLLSTILSNRNRVGALGGSSVSGNKTLG